MRTKLLVSAVIGIGVALSGAAVALADEPTNPSDINFGVLTCTNDDCSAVPVLVKSGTSDTVLQQILADQITKMPAPPSPAPTP